jgi:hypothetical protein
VTRQSALLAIALAAVGFTGTATGDGVPWAAAGAPQQASPAPAAETGDTDLLSRAFVVGTSSRVRELIKTNPQGHQFNRALNEVRVDERPAPMKCGVPLARYFRERIVTTFNVAPTNDCKISNESVVCQSNMLPGYSRTYLSFAYTWQPTEVNLALVIRQQGLWGAVKNPQLAGNHVEWMEGVFDCMVAISECGSALPRCAQTR